MPPWRWDLWAKPAGLRLFAPVEYQLDDDTEAAQATAEEDADGRAGKRGKSAGLHVLPDDNVPKEFGRDRSGEEAEHTAHDQSGQRGNGHGGKGFDSGHGGILASVRKDTDGCLSSVFSD